MSDDMKAVRRKRSDAETLTEAPVKKIKKRKYIVKKNHHICVAKDVYHSGGDVIFLDKKMAKHFVGHGCIEAYVDFDADED